MHFYLVIVCRLFSFACLFTFGVILYFVFLLLLYWVFAFCFLRKNFNFDREEERRGLDELGNIECDQSIFKLKIILNYKNIKVKMLQMRNTFSIKITLS